MRDYDDTTADERVAERRARLIAAGSRIVRRARLRRYVDSLSLAAIGIACFWAVASSRRLTSYYPRGWTTSRTCLARMWSNW